MKPEVQMTKKKFLTFGHLLFTSGPIPRGLPRIRHSGESRNPETNGLDAGSSPA